MYSSFCYILDGGQKMPRYNFDISNILFEEDVKKMYDATKKRQEALLISLCWLTGGRPSEIVKGTLRVGLKKDNIILTDDNLSITLKTLKRNKKDNKQFDYDKRTLSFSRPHGLDENIYIETIANYINAVDEDRFLLPYSTRWAELTLNRIGNQQLGKLLTPYHFRHSVMSWLSANGFSVPELAAFKGAKDWRSVQPYIHARPQIIEYQNMNRSKTPAQVTKRGKINIL